MLLSLLWPIVSDDTICKQQNVMFTANLFSCVLNGFYAIPLAAGNIIDFSSRGFVRNTKITLTKIGSTSYTGNITIHIDGSQNSVNVSEDIIVTDATVAYTKVLYSAKTYSIINSITVRQSVTDPVVAWAGNITVGIGKIGFFDVIDIIDNVDSASHAYALSFVPKTSAGIGCTYHIYETLNEDLDSSYEQLLTDQVFKDVPSITGQPLSGSHLYQLNDICTYLLIQVASPSDDTQAANCTLRFHFVSIE